MMKNVFRLAGHADAGSETTQPQSMPGLHEDYRDLVQRELGALGVPPGVVEVEIVSFGCSPDGRESYGALLKLVRWDQLAVPRLLLGPGLLEMRIRNALTGSWLPQVSLFAGTWVRVSSRLSAGEGGTALKNTLTAITASRHLARAAAAGNGQHEAHVHEP